MKVFLRVSDEIYETVRDHLFRDELEQLAFLFAQVVRGSDSVIFEASAYHLVQAEGFAIQHRFYFELTDEEKAKIIKTAWDQGRALVEMHSHPKAQEMMAFSPSDLLGLEEYVPHVWWRLKGKPYMAVVLGLKSFDALAWLSDPRAPEPVEAILVGRDILQPSRLTYSLLKTGNS